jgi:Hemerythrin HHE cation binding domain
VRSPPRGTARAVTARMKNPGSALELLTAQHDEVDELFDAIEALDDRAGKVEIFEDLADQLAAHATIEERLFYPWAKRPETEELLHESTEEHLAIKRLIADLLALDADDPQWDAKISVLKENVHHHAREEEEAKLFPILRRTSSAEDRAALGGEMTAMFERLMAGAPREDVPAQIDRAAPV